MVERKRVDVGDGRMKASIAYLLGLLAFVLVPRIWLRKTYEPGTHGDNWGGSLHKSTLQLILQVAHVPHHDVQSG